MQSAWCGSALGFAVRRFVPQWLLWRLAKRFIAGRTREEAYAAAVELQTAGYRVSLNYLGEDATDHRMARPSIREYSALTREVKFLQRRADIALKLSQFGIIGDNVSESTRAAGHGTLDDIMERLRLLNPSGGHVLWIDAERLQWRDATWRTATRLVAPVGICVQAYAEDAVPFVQDRLREGWRGPVRVCKGGYREPGMRTLTGSALQDNFLSLCKLVLEHGVLLQAATHDRAIIRAVRELRGAREYGVLYGVDPGLTEEILRNHGPVNIYMPYGEDIRGYVSRRITERPAYALLPFRRSSRRANKLRVP